MNPLFKKVNHHHVFLYITSPVIITGNSKEKIIQSFLTLGIVMHHALYILSNKFLEGDHDNDGFVRFNVPLVFLIIQQGLHLLKTSYQHIPLTISALQGAQDLIFVAALCASHLYLPSLPQQQYEYHISQ